jgi:hypothetical protein
VIDSVAGGGPIVVVEPTSITAAFAPAVDPRAALSAPTATTALPPTRAAPILTLRRLVEFIAHPVCESRL